MSIHPVPLHVALSPRAWLHRLGLVYLLTCHAAKSYSLEPTLLDKMDSPATALQVADPRQLVSQEVLRGAGRFGVGAERLLLRIPAGNMAEVTYRLPRAPILPELRLEAWILTNRPHSRLGVRVELPRSIDPETGRARRLLVRGASVANQGEWQRVTLGDLPRAVERAVRTARLEWEGAVDAREAVAVELVLLTPGGSDPTELLVDQIAMFGVLAESQHPKTIDASIQMTSAALATLEGREITHPTPASGTPPSLETVEKRVARIIQWQGEPLEMLKKLGFDAIAMVRPPEASERAAAEKLGLRIVCPPPDQALSDRALSDRAQPIGAGDGEQTTNRAETTAALAEKDSPSDPYQVVAAWDLGIAASPGDVASAARVRRALHGDLSGSHRPTLLRPGAFPAAASRTADLLLLERPLTSAANAMDDYTREITRQLRLMRPGTSIWATLPTHNSMAEMTQLQSLRGGGPAVVAPRYQTLLQTAFAAALGRPKAFYFESLVNLDRRDDAAVQRCLTLQLTNLRLGLVDPWLNSGKPLAAARCSRNDVGALVLLTERSYLVLPLYWNSEPSHVDPPQVRDDAASFVLPGPAESSEAYLLTMTHSQRLPTRRVAGGLRIDVHQLPSDALILVTEDGVAASQVDRYLRRYAAQAAAIRTELVGLRLGDANHAWGLLPTSLATDAAARRELHRAETFLSEAKEAVQSHRHAQAYQAAAQCDETLDDLLYAMKQRIASADGEGPFPLVVDWATLGDFALAAAAGERQDIAWQLAPAGDFEDLPTLLTSGWQRMELPNAGLATAVRLSPTAPSEGDFCLELEALPAGANVPPPVVAAPPVWVSSPPFAIPAGYMLEVRGMVRNGWTNFRGQPPLAVFDSLGGESMAIRTGTDPTWRPFRLLRASGNSATTQITLALRQPGRVQVDALEFRVVPLAPEPLAAKPSR